MKRFLAAFGVVLGLLGSSLSLAQTVSTTDRAESGVIEPGIDQWLTRLQDASRLRRTYVGTFVVTAGNHMSSSRIWHVCDGQQQIERVDALTGVPRSTFRRNDQIVTFLPESRVAVRETRESLGLFPDVLNQADASIVQSYRLKVLGRERVAGLDADVVQLLPVDVLRYGYRVWTERKTGLVIKLQTLNDKGLVLEQASFSELQLDVPLTFAKLSSLMDNTRGYRVQTPELIKTTADQEGWIVRRGVAGFKTMSCNRRAGALPSMAKGVTLQCVFSDGLASVSLFVEAFDPLRHGKLPQHDKFAMGATSMLMRQMGDHWVTAVGEVPAQTLSVFVQGLERKK